jgi:hypothetical protein
MKQYLGKAALLAVISFLFYKSCAGFQRIAWGTGVWWGEYSMKWAAAYVLACVICVFAVVLIGMMLFQPGKFQTLFQKLISLRERSGKIRWFLALLVLIFPVWLLQYTFVGVIVHDTYIRLLLWSMVVIVLSFLITRGDFPFRWKQFLLSVLVTSGELVVAIPFVEVTSYPFSLGWSEGNRLWDYSIMFGRYLYDYPANAGIPVFLDASRQFIGGLPYLIPGLTIGMERFWVGLTVVLPYLILGFAAFRFTRRNWMAYFLAALWTLLFLKQGPIHPPLVLCAAVVALVWRSPLWLAIPLIALTGYAAEYSRYTWLFAPGMWIGMLELAGAELWEGKLSRSAWVRAISLGFFGIAGGLFGSKIHSLIAGWLAGAAVATNAAPATSVTVTTVSDAVGKQPLLWYRLFPNATYGNGILIGLLLATLPLIVVLLYLAISKKWKLNIWQVLAIVSPLLAFLVVGIIVSTKIGGGGDLHNMDMFLIGLFFAAVIAWESGGREWLANVHLSPLWIKIVVLLLFALPGYQSLKDMRSYTFDGNPVWLATLADAPTVEDLELHPSREIADASLETIRQEVALAHSQPGEILFLDQRQLLTFGFVEDVPLVAQYEKKLLMNHALSSNAKYFKTYYADLAAKRFSLIISEPLRKPVKDSSYQFGEENNAWVKWVSIPTLCYYEPKVTLKEVGVQLLVPRADTSDCDSLLPEGSVPD